MKPETVYFQINLASPMHVGCGEVYEPMGFVIDEDRRELISFTVSDFLARLNSDDLKSYSSICQHGSVESIQRLYKFMRSHQKIATGHRITISNGFYQHYKSVLEKPENAFKNEVTDFAIHRTAFNPFDNEPVIPGSSIKGAIRTAVLNFRNKGKTSPRFPGRNGNRELQEHLLGGSFDRDPFSLLKVSDFIPAGEVKRTIKYSVSFSKNDGKKKLPQMQEVIEPGSRFWGSIAILPGSSAIGNKALTLPEIIDSLCQFYGDEKKREDKELRKIRVEPVNFKAENVIPLRIGKHSGAECITVKGHRHIKISPPGKPLKFSKTDGGATTVWLASDSRKPDYTDGLSAMGWVRLYPLDASELKELFRQRKQYHVDQQERISQEQIQKQKRRQSRLQKARDEEEKRKELEKQAASEAASRKAQKQQWLQMPEEEQDLAIVRGDEIAKINAPKADIYGDIWPKIESATPEHKKELANALKDRWQKEGRWNKKQCSKKQWIKVQKVKKIIEMK